MKGTDRTRTAQRTANEDEPGVVFAPEAVRRLKLGVDTMADAVRPTLGPLSRNVAIAANLPSKPPELLDDAATIARRIIQIPDPYVDAGAMLLRHVLWTLHEDVGDGGATAAVLMQALIREAIRLSAAGWNVMSMRRGIEQGRDCALAALKGMARPVETEADVAALALSQSADSQLAAMLGEIYDTIGAEGHIIVEESYRAGLSREYVEGMYWKSGWITSSMATNEASTEAKLSDAFVLVVRGFVSTVDQLMPVLNAVVGQPNPSLFIVANDVSGQALNLLLSNTERVKSAAVKAPHYGEHMTNILDDIAILTGARVVLAEMGEDMGKLGIKDLGRARSVTVNRDYFGIAGGRGDAKLLRQRIASLRNYLKEADRHDNESVQQVRERLAKLLGGVAVLHVGGITEAEAQARTARAERTANTLRHALSEGIVPGGGMSYLRCIEALNALKLPEEEAVGVQALSKALEEPLRAIARNSGADQGPVVAIARRQPAGWGYNAVTGQYEDLWKAGVVDPLRVVTAALSTAVSGAIMILTTDAVVHQRTPPQSINP